MYVIKYGLQHRHLCSNQWAIWNVEQRRGNLQHVAFVICNAVPANQSIIELDEHTQSSASMWHMDQPNVYSMTYTRRVVRLTPRILKKREAVVTNNDSGSNSSGMTHHDSCNNST